MTRIEREKRVVGIMIRLYCIKKEGNTMLCEDCRTLLEYAYLRLDCCPFGEKKLRVNVAVYIAIGRK